MFISHDLAVVRAVADRIVVMHHGRIVEEGEPETILFAPGADYTRGLIEAHANVDAAIVRCRSRP